MSIFSKLKAPDRRGVPCSFCPNIIHVHNEVSGILYIASGRPICAVCRVMRRSRFAVKMRSDAKVARSNVGNIINQQVEDVATASQKRGSVDSDKKKELMKKLHKK